jgi:hypothetical protein
MRTSFHHQPEAQHPKSPAIETPAGRLPHLRHFASFRCAAKFGRYQSIADITQTSREPVEYRYRSSPTHSATTITSRY